MDPAPFLPPRSEADRSARTGRVAAADGRWGSGFQDYALRNQTNSRVHLPIESFYVQAAYLLTGARVARRGMVKPLQPFDLRPGRFGLGAWEVAFRYSGLSLGRQVFTAGLADPNLWTNQLFTTDLGIN